jgi:hypothetical protein
VTYSRILREERVLLGEMETGMPGPETVRERWLPCDEEGRDSLREAEEEEEEYWMK